MTVFPQHFLIFDFFPPARGLTIKCIIEYPPAFICTVLSPYCFGIQAFTSFIVSLNCVGVEALLVEAFTATNVVWGPWIVSGGLVACHQAVGTLQSNPANRLYLWKSSVKSSVTTLGKYSLCIMCILILSYVTTQHTTDLKKNHTCCSLSSASTKMNNFRHPQELLFTGNQ
jgi:hypothetical protein